MTPAGTRSGSLESPGQSYDARDPFVFRSCAQVEADFMNPSRWEYPHREGGAISNMLTQVSQSIVKGLRCCGAIWPGIT